MANTKRQDIRLLELLKGREPLAVIAPGYKVYEDPIYGDKSPLILVVKNYAGELRYILQNCWEISDYRNLVTPQL